MLKKLRALGVAGLLGGVFGVAAGAALAIYFSIDGGSWTYPAGLFGGSAFAGAVAGTVFALLLVAVNVTAPRVRLGPLGSSILGVGSAVAGLAVYLLLFQSGLSSLTNATLPELAFLGAVGAGFGALVGAADRSDSLSVASSEDPTLQRLEDPR